jgi:apolipoprotein N-acyltransferase
VFILLTKRKKKMKLKRYHKLLLSVLSGVLLSLGYTQIGLGWVILFAFIPILILRDAGTKDENKNGSNYVFLWSLISFIVWNTISTWWIYYSTAPGAVVAVLLSSVFMASVIWLASLANKYLGKKTGYVAFVSFWMSFEYLFLNSQVSWPWLILGNSFANNIAWVQWYEFTGHLGGSLWILTINILLYELVKSRIENKGKNILLRKYLTLGLVIFVPLTYSLIRYYTYTETENPVDVVVFQPNIDPYGEKYNIPDWEQVENMFILTDSLVDSDVDFIVGPETAIPNGMWLDELHEERNITFIRNYLKQYPKAACIIGAVTRKYYPNGKGKTETAKPFGSTGDFYDLYNTAIYIDTSDNIQVYHKSRLVPGVEMMPYPRVFGFLGELIVDLGGIRGRLGYQEEQTPLVRKSDSVKIGSVICYESVYGEFYSKFVKNGAQLMAIITNDGWWSNTAGHRQHKSYASLRAVETRRSIARSANTGISCFVNQRGDILMACNWWEKDVIRTKLNLNDKITFYTKYGNYLSRMSLVVSALLALAIIPNIIMKRKRKKKQLNQ